MRIESFSDTMRPLLTAELQEYLSSFPAEQAEVERGLAFIANTTDLFDRFSPVGHITCSAWVLDHTATRAALVFHRRLARWVQPGGHIEALESPRQGALREAQEETGIEDLTLLDQRLFHFEIFAFPSGKDGPPHLHYDLRYLFQAQAPASLSHPPEMAGAAWINLSELAEYSDEPTIQTMRQRTQLWLEKIRMEGS